MTTHKFHFHSSANMSELPDCSVDLVVTSPPYPMIHMWDNQMFSQNNIIKQKLPESPMEAFKLMHQELDRVWKECYRVMKKGSFLCINIGDATRTFNGEFSLYSNYSHIISACEKIGFITMPNIIWHKISNSPNKFMGSGMLPCGAYVTLDHEYILIFKKGSKREFNTDEEKKLRRESSYFWEERNIWFSDIWDVKGVQQRMSKNQPRDKNASYPMEIPYRLINMFSVRNDVVLDPFAGLGTTAIAAIRTERNSVNYEIEDKLCGSIEQNVDDHTPGFLCKLIWDRVITHQTFIEEYKKSRKDVKYFNEYINCGVITKQETDIVFNYVKNIKKTKSDDLCLSYSADYYPVTDLSPNKLF